MTAQRQPSTDGRGDTESSGLSRRDFVRASAAAGAGALALGSTTSASAQSYAREMCDNEASFDVNEHFRVLNNPWSNPTADQCIVEYEDGAYGWHFEGGDCSGGQEDYCINYPEVFCGRRPWGQDTGVPEFQGLTLGDVEELEMEYDTEIQIDYGEWNLTEEWWLLDDEPNEDGPTTHEIMLVCDWGGGHSEHHTPPDRPDLWTDKYGNTVDLWNVTTGGTGDTFYIFALSNPSPSGKVDLKEIVDYLIEEEHVSENRIVSGIEFGTETFDGPKGSIRWNQFDVTINGSTYTSGPEGGNGQTGSAPDAPGWVSADAGETSVDVSWESVDDADEYVAAVGSMEETTSTTSASFSGLSSGTSYEASVVAVNDHGESPEATTSFTTDEETTVACEGAADSEELSNGRTVCDVNGDGNYRDLNGDEQVNYGDLQEFYQNQHVDPIDSRADLFDYNGDGDVSTADVITLFEDI